MRLPSNRVYAPSGMDKLALDVAHAMMTSFAQQTRALCGAEKLGPDQVPLVTSGLLNYGYGYFLEVEPQSLEHEIVLREHPWIAGAACVICISPELSGLPRGEQLRVIQKFTEEGVGQTVMNGLWPKYD